MRNVELIAVSLGEEREIGRLGIGTLGIGEWWAEGSGKWVVDERGKKKEWIGWGLGG